MKKFDVAHHRHVNLLLSVNLINDFKILLRDISNAQVLSLAQCIRVYGSDYATEILFVTTIATAHRSEAFERAPSATPLVLKYTSSVILLVSRNWFQAVRNLKKTAGAA